MTAWRELGLKDEEYKKIITLMGREPNQTELAMFSVLWSEHCAYKHSRARLGRLPTTGRHIVQGPGENAGVADIGEGMVVCWKMESHNHPSAIEPFQGAATGVGGIVRDILAMGARPVALLDSLRFGELAGDPHVSYLMTGVVAGISAYGNCIGVPTVGGEVQFDSSYRDNPLVNVMCVGIARREDLVSATARGQGNSLLLVGNRTGRDGIHGCTFASEELSAESAARRPAVQVADPFTEKLLIEACLEALTTGHVVGLQDLGAAGLTSSTAETAARAGTGLRLDVSLVPRREPGMTSYEVMISESQERMLLIVKQGHEQQVADVFDRWGLMSTVIGHVTDTERLEVYEGEKLVADVPVKALTDQAPRYQPEGIRPDYLDRIRADDELAPVGGPWPDAGGRILHQLLRAPSIASKRSIWEQYDHMVQLGTVVLPGSDAAVIRVQGTDRGLALSADGNGRACYLDPERGGRLCVAEAGRNVVCAGGRPIGITNCLNFGNPEKPDVFWQFAGVIDGMAAACRALDMPVTGGNVSFYNEAGANAVFPTPVIGAVGLVQDVTRCPRTGLDRAGDEIWLLGSDEVGVGGSELLYRVGGRVGGRPLDVDLDRERALWEVVLSLIDAGAVSTAHDCSDGGLAVALAECAILSPRGHGAVVELPGIQDRPEITLFGEGPGRIIVAGPPDSAARIIGQCEKYGVSCHRLGVVGGDRMIIRCGGTTLVDEVVADLAHSYETSIPALTAGEDAHV